MSLHIIILAAGQGKRMHTTKLKVLHTVGGKSMLERVVDVASQLNADGIYVVYGYGGDQLKEALPFLPVHWVLQKEQLGTGHAVTQVLPLLPDEGKVLVLSADVPLIQAQTLKQLIAQCQVGNNHHRASLGILQAVFDNPFGLGRILYDEKGSICAIIEEKDASEQQRKIKEIYSGICCATIPDLKRWLPKLCVDNAQGEYYLTGIIALAAVEGAPIVSCSVVEPNEILGVNNLLQLQEAERIWQRRFAVNLMLSGVRLADAARIDIRGELACGKDVFIDINAVIEGNVVIGEGCIIEPNCLLRNVTLGAFCVIHANSVLDGCEIGDKCHIGPFSRLRPGTTLAERCKIGNFVETKNASLGENSKASHLSYLGDTLIGKDVNIGAGTITCNYDGANKHQTTIEDGVFVGSDTQLIAPVTVGKNATIGAGCTIRKNVPAGELTIMEVKQKVINGWSRPKKN
jgi:bifunctional UDP-N-acetylglucosamine pyrophosphorylase/glucosamine-1-phosphate N-acetyltransferase